MSSPASPTAPETAPATSRAFALIVLMLAAAVLGLAPVLVRLTETGPRPRVTELAPGEVLFEQGARGQLIYLIESGEIRIERDRPDHSTELLATLGSGEHFGEMGPLFDLPRSATARAAGQAVVTGYTPEQFRVHVGAERLTDLIRHDGDL